MVPRKLQRMLVMVILMIQLTYFLTTRLSSDQATFIHSGSMCKAISCASLLLGNPLDPYDHWLYDTAANCATTDPPTFYTTEDYKILTRNCSQFKKSRGYIQKTMSAEEADFPIAYNLLVHKDIEQAERLLRAIYHPQNSYCIHLDGNANAAMHAAIKSIAACFHNVFTPTVTENIVYGGFSRLQADINCMKDHLRSEIKWKYLMNIAGQAFPLKTNLEMVRILKLANGVDAIDSTGRIYTNRFEYQWTEYNSGMSVSTTKKNPPLPHNITLYKGSAYGVFSRDFVNYLLNDRRSLDLLDWSRNTYSPDEHYWATMHRVYSDLHKKSPRNATNSLVMPVYVKWKGEGEECYGLWKRDVCVFGVKDLPSLVEHKHMFCNKFYQDYQPLAYACLEAYIRQRTICPQPI